MSICTYVVVVVSGSCNLMDGSPRDPLSMGFPRQKYWSGLPFPSPGELPDLGIEPASPPQAGRVSTTEPSWEPHMHLDQRVNNQL